MIKILKDNQLIKLERIICINFLFLILFENKIQVKIESIWL